MNEDRSHLNALAIAHYVLGGFGVFTILVLSRESVKEIYAQAGE